MASRSRLALIPVQVSASSCRLAHDSVAKVEAFEAGCCAHREAARRLPLAAPGTTHAMKPSKDGGSRVLFVGCDLRAHQVAAKRGGGGGGGGFCCECMRVLSARESVVLTPSHKPSSVLLMPWRCTQTPEAWIRAEYNLSEVVPCAGICRMVSSRISWQVRSLSHHVFANLAC